MPQSSPSPERCHPVILLAVLSLLVPTVVCAQFLYLDSNGDGISSSEDVLSPEGVPTSINVYLDTSRNPDSSTAFCSTPSESLTMNSYEFILRATGGTITYGDYANAQPSMTISLGQGSSETDFFVGFGGGAILSPGLYHLGTLIATVQEGSPSLLPASATALEAHFGTSFGTRCPGQEGDNTYRLGIDWHGIAGCGPPGGGNAYLAGAVPPSTVITGAAAVALTGEFSDLDVGDPINITVSGLPPGLKAVEGWQRDGRKQARVYGHLGAADNETHVLTWRASDGTVSSEFATILQVRPSSTPQDELRRLVREIVTTRYQHGIPRSVTRRLGSEALPFLAELLRDANEKRSWANVVIAIGSVGDTAYFDTLTAFVKTRFRGTIDTPTLLAIHIAQSNLGPMATLSGRALEYLVESLNPNAWMNLPWVVTGKSPELVRDLMVTSTITSLSYTDSEAVRDVLESTVPQGMGGVEPLYGGFEEVYERVRMKGFVRVWEEDEPR